MAEKNYLQKLHEEYLEKFRVRTIHELIECFNREVGCKGWTGSRGAYLVALRDVFEESDYELDSSVFMEGSTSYSRKIKLEGNKIVPCD